MDDPISMLLQSIHDQSMRTAQRMAALGHGFAQMAQAIEQLAHVAMAPKRAIRGATGQIEGVETVMPEQPQ